MKNKLNLINNDIEELNNKLQIAKKEYVKLLYDKSTKALKDTSLLRKKRKEIARIKTFINQLKKSKN